MDVGVPVPHAEPAAPAVPAPLPPPGAAAGFVQPEEPEFEYPVELETPSQGMRRIHEQRGWNRGRPYHRLLIHCTAHDGCHTQREISVQTCRALGDMEPMAFLGAWIEAAGDFTTAAAHSRHRPAIAAVRAFFDNM